jgi:hypothetical protein
MQVLWNVGLGQHLAAVSYPVPSLFNSRVTQYQDLPGDKAALTKALQSGAVRVKAG